MAVNTHQDHYRIRSDTTGFNPGTPIWQTTQDQATPLNWPEALAFRIRFTVSNTGTTNTSINPWSIWVSRNGGAYSQVTTTSAAVRMDPTASTDVGSVTLSSTQRLLTAGTGTAANGLATDDNNATGALRLSASTYCEFEFGMRLVLGGVNDNDTLDFRVRFNGAVLNSYTITPRIIVYVDDGIGAAQGDAAAAANGASLFKASGAASGDAIAAGVINIAKDTAGTAAGDSAASAVGTGHSPGIGDAQGDSAAAAVGSTTITHYGAGVAQGDAIVDGVSLIPVFHLAVGFAQGDADAVAISEGALIGTAVGDSVAQGYSFSRLPRAWHTQTRIGQRAPKARTEITQ